MREPTTGRSLSLPPGHRVHLNDTPEAASIRVADRIVDAILANAGSTNPDSTTTFSRPTVLGLATGTTPVHVYAELVRRHQAGLSFRNVRTVNLDEYWPIALDHPASFHRFMHVHLFDHVDIPKGMRHVPNGSLEDSAVEDHCAQFEANIAQAGGVDCQLLGIGGNGHIGFNEPGSRRTTRTRRVSLTARTRADNACAFGGEESMPTHAITMGIGTILEARSIVVLALGAGKADIVRAALLGPITEDVPASLLRTHPSVEWVFDRNAAADLPG